MYIILQEKIRKVNIGFFCQVDLTSQLGSQAEPGEANPKKYMFKIR